MNPHSILSSENRSGPMILCCQKTLYTFNFGVAYLAGALKSEGESVQVMNWPSIQSEIPSFVQEVIARRPVLLGFSGLFDHLYIVGELIQAFDKAGRNFPIAIGGQMVSPTPELALNVTGADIGAIGEAEITLPALVKALREGASPLGVPGYAVRVDGGQVVLTGAGDYIHDMAKLPPVPYEMFPAEEWLSIGEFYARTGQPHWHFNDRVVPVHGGRGCPHRCNFCYHHSTPRYRDIDQMMDEAEILVERYSANMLYFGDDLVLCSPARAQKLVQRIKKMKKRVEYSVSSRFDVLDRIDDELLREMKATGCRIMGIGIESGSQRVLDAIGKKITVEQIYRGLSRLKKAGILPTGAVMVGQVNETEAEVDETVKLVTDTMRENPNMNYAFTIATPYPGSDMFEYCKQKGLLKDDLDFYNRFNPKLGWGRIIVNASAMSDATVQRRFGELQKTYESVYRSNLSAPASIIEALRRFIARVDGKLGPVARRLPGYAFAYCRAQTVLDSARLRLRGL